MKVLFVIDFCLWFFEFMIVIVWVVVCSCRMRFVVCWWFGVSWWCWWVCCCCVLLGGLGGGWCVMVCYWLLYWCFDRCLLLFYVRICMLVDRSSWCVWIVGWGWFWLFICGWVWVCWCSIWVVLICLLWIGLCRVLLVFFCVCWCSWWLCCVCGVIVWVRGCVEWFYWWFCWVFVWWFFELIWRWCLYLMWFFDSGCRSIVWRGIYWVFLVECEFFGGVNWILFCRSSWRFWVWFGWSVLSWLGCGWVWWGIFVCWGLMGRGWIWGCCCVWRLVLCFDGVFWVVSCGSWLFMSLFGCFWDCWWF